MAFISMQVRLHIDSRLYAGSLLSQFIYDKNININIRRISKQHLKLF